MIERLTYEEIRALQKNAYSVRQYKFGEGMSFWEIVTPEKKTIVFIDLPANGTDWWERFFGLKSRDVYLQINGIDHNRVKLEINDFIERMNRKYQQAYGIKNRFRGFRE